MPRGSIALDTWEPVEKVTSTKMRFRRGDILFGRLRPYFKKVGIAAVDGVCSSDILVVRPLNDLWAGFLTFHVSEQKLIDYTDAVSNGAKMPRVGWRDLARYELPLPSPAIAKAFNRHAGPVVGQLRATILESRTLTAIRDALLPKLLSGELRVREAERVVEQRT